MTKETMDLCNGEMEEAIQSGDQTRIWRANARFNRAMMDCQYKTATRVKWLVKAVYVLASSIVAVAAGGGDVLLKIVKMFVAM